VLVAGRRQCTCRPTDNDGPEPGADTFAESRMLR
jgi:hypothetical protein